jgi:hypothetical protein
MPFLLSLFRTGQAQSGRGISVQPAISNGVLAANTLAKLTALNAAQGRSDVGNLLFSAGLCGQGHRLTLQGVHARQPPNSGLVEFYRTRTGTADISVAF